VVSSGRVHARNLIANWTGHGANLVVMFFLSPFIIHTLGSVEYGIWGLLGVLTGYAGLLDLGVRVSTSRYIVLYFGKGDDVRLDETIRTALGFLRVGGRRGVSPNSTKTYAPPPLPFQRPFSAPAKRPKPPVKCRQTWPKSPHPGKACQKR